MLWELTRWAKAHGPGRLLLVLRYSRTTSSNRKTRAR